MIKFVTIQHIFSKKVRKQNKNIIIIINLMSENIFNNNRLKSELFNNYLIMMQKYISHKLISIDITYYNRLQNRYINQQ